MNSKTDTNNININTNNDGIEKIIKIMDIQKEELRKKQLDKTGLKLKHLLITDMNGKRIKCSKDIEDFIKITQMSLYPSDEETMIDIYNFSNDNDNNDSIINDLKQNYYLTEKYLLTFKSIMNNEVNKLIKNLVIKKETLNEVEEKKLNNKIVKIKQNDKDTKLEGEILNRVSILPSDIINLIRGFVLTHEIRLLLIKQKYDNDIFNIINKMNATVLNKFINRPGNVRRDINRYLTQQSQSKYFSELIKEYNIRGHLYINLSLKKPIKIKYLIDEMNNKYNLFKLLNNMNKYNDVCNKIIEHLIKCYNTYIYISNRTTELNNIKLNEKKQSRKLNLQQQQANPNM